MRYVVCDDHRLFIEPFAAALGRRGYDVIVLTRPAQLPTAVERHRPELCVVDLRFPEGSGIEAIGEVRRRSPGTRVVVLSGSTDVRDAAAAAAAGAAGFRRKAQPMSVLFDALDRIAAGGVVAPVPPTPRWRG